MQCVSFTYNGKSFYAALLLLYEQQIFFPPFLPLFSPSKFFHNRGKRKRRKEKRRKERKEGKERGKSVLFSQLGGWKMATVFWRKRSHYGRGPMVVAIHSRKRGGKFAAFSSVVQYRYRTLCCYPTYMYRYYKLQYLTKWYVASKHSTL